MAGGGTLGCTCILVALCYFIHLSSTGDARTFDTLFLVDSSNSARDRDKYDVIRRFVSSLSQQLVKTRQHRVAIVSFSDVVYRLNLKFTDDPKQMENGLKTLNKTGGFSYVTDDVIVKMFNKSKLGDGKQVVTVLGRSPETSDAISKTAKSLKSRGLEMFCVGIGPDFFKNTKDLRALSSVPLKDHTLRTTYGSLLKAAPVMLKKLQTDASAVAATDKFTRYALKLTKVLPSHHSAPKAHTKHRQHLKMESKSQPKPQSHHSDSHISSSQPQHHDKGVRIPKAPLKTHKKASKHKSIRSRTRSTELVWADPSQPRPEARPFTDQKNAPSEAGLMNIIDVSEKDASYDRTTTNVATNLLLDYFGSGISTVGTPNTASPDMGNLITNTTNNGGGPSCVGSVPLANRIITNGTMVTGIVPANQNATTTRNCADQASLEEGISTGESGIDATWDYGKK